MAIWKLEPVDTGSPDLEASAYRGTVIVRARSENKARDIAYSAFVVATDTLREKNALNPWLNASLVSARMIDNSGYEETGKEEIVGPPEAIAFLS